MTRLFGLLYGAVVLAAVAQKQKRKLRKIERTVTVPVSPFYTGKQIHEYIAEIPPHRIAQFSDAWEAQSRAIIGARIDVLTKPRIPFAPEPRREP